MWERSRTFYILNAVTYFSSYQLKVLVQEKIKLAILYLFSLIIISLIHNGTNPLQYLKIVFLMQDSALSEVGNQFILLKWVTHIWEHRVNPNKDTCICFVLSGACVLEFVFNCFKNILLLSTSFHISLTCPLGKLPLTLKALHFLE